MMHSRFFRDSLWKNGMYWKSLASVCFGAFGGFFAFFNFSDSLYPNLVFGIVAARFRLVHMLLCGLLPLLLCFACWSLWRKSTLLPLTIIPFSFLLTFSACAMCSCSYGWLLALLLLSSRCISLACVFWFMLRRNRFGDAFVIMDLCLSSALTVLTLLVFHWLTESGVAVFATI